MSLAKRGIPGAALAVAFLGVSATQALAQQVQQSKEGASIIVEGVVREIFRSPRQTRTDYLVQIEVSRSEYGRSPTEPRRVQAPAPGDQVYVHLSQANEHRDRPGAGGAQALPDERTQIRAYLYPRAQGGWEGASPDWYDQTNASIASRGAHDPEPPADVPLRPAPTPAPVSPSGGDILRKLGVKAEQLQVSGRLVLKVSEVIPDSPAQRAGLETGDAIIGINGGFITSLDQLAATLGRGGQPTLAVLDVNSGRTSKVKIDLSGLGMAGAPQPQPQPRPSPTPSPAPAPVPGRVLGVKAEPARIGLRTTALRVTEIQPGSPAEKAGIEKGDMIVAANGAPTGDIPQLNAAIQASGPVLTLTVRDSRTGRDVPVQVELVSAPSNVPADKAPAPGPPSGGGGSASALALGINTEAGTADLLPVVKVVKVQPGSPAEKAGIEPGDAIVGLNDKVIFAPDLLDEALKTAGNSFTLNILDVKTGRKKPVKVNLP
jgi:S1-C subfamily serine protease